ncbi:helix-turn-helix transcriptional regulator [Sphingorhabdus sp. SMR4y]|uniref:helix-turn-helix transcriptional regulator n=1 Tax=Sphingorhabdus sp. SMR4y TaxID=2584094 RepID=UPI000B5CC991|nr:transcriptional regulator [Sphingorhabdus sp. SMR4y]
MKINDIDATADQIGVRPSCLAKWRVTGEGPKFAKLGKRVVYRQQDIDQWIESKVRSSTSGAA